MSAPPIKSILEDHPHKAIADRFMIDHMSGLDRNAKMNVVVYLLYCVCRACDASIADAAEAAEDYARFDQTLS